MRAKISVLLLAVVAGFWIHGLLSPSLIPQKGPPHEHSDSKARAPLRQPSISPATVQPIRTSTFLAAETDATGVTLLVSDISGNPLAHAQAIIHVRHLRRIDISVCPPTAESNKDGLILLATEACRHKSVTLYLQGYVPVTVEEPCEGETIVVVMAREILCTVEVLDRARKPVRGVRLQASRASVGYAEHSKSSLYIAGGPPATQIHEAVSDDRGVVTLTGLSPGRYGIRVDSDAHIAIDWPIVRFVDVPAEQLSVTVARVLGVAANVSGDAVLSSKIITKRYDGEGSNPDSEMNIGDRLTAIEELLRLKCGRPDVLLALVPSDDDIDTHVSIEFWLDKCGLVLKQVRAVAIADIVKPERIVFEGAGKPSRGANVTISVMQPDGKSEVVGMPLLHLTKKGEWGSHYRKRKMFRSGDTFALTAGTYTIGTMNQVLAHSFETQEFDVVAGYDKPVVFKLSRPLLECRFEAVAGDIGVMYCGVSVELADGDRVGGVGQASSMTWWLPEQSSGTFKVSAVGYTSYEANFVVPRRTINEAGDSRAIFRAILVPAPNAK